MLKSYSIAEEFNIKNFSSLIIKMNQKRKFTLHPLRVSETDFPVSRLIFTMKIVEFSLLNLSLI